MRLKETKEVLDFVIGLGEALAHSLEDGSLSVGDLINFWEPVSNIASAIEGFEDVLEEISNLTADDLDHLADYVEDEFDIHDDNLEEMIEAGLQTAVNLLKFVGQFRA
jgi:hypothetical protein